eukprot:365960-Chlamydomonas_euryale.AAC.3
MPVGSLVVSVGDQRESHPEVKRLRACCPQVPVIQVMLGQLGVVSSEQMFSLWRYVVVGSTVVAAVLTPSTDPFTQVGCAVCVCGGEGGGAAPSWRLR